MDQRVNIDRAPIIFKKRNPSPEASATLVYKLRLFVISNVYFVLYKHNVNYLQIIILHFIYIATTSF